MIQPGIYYVRATIGRPHRLFVGSAIHRLVCLFYAQGAAFLTPCIMWFSGTAVRMKMYPLPGTTLLVTLTQEIACNFVNSLDKYI